MQHTPNESAPVAAASAGDGGTASDLAPPAGSEASIAELIGWELVDNPWYGPRSPHEPRRRIRTPDGQYWNTSKRPEVDDLLAWLREQGWQTHTVTGVLDPRTHCYLTKFAGVEHMEIGFFPTLLAALESAVRAVAS